MSQNEKPPTNTFPWATVLTLLGVVLAASITAYVNHLNTRSQIEIPIQYTQTAEAKLPTLPVQVSLSSTDAREPAVFPNQFSCTFLGRTDEETIENLIRAEATAVNAKDFTIILAIFAPDAEFYDYAQTPPGTWKGPSDRYQKNLFQNTEFQGVQHLKITPVGPGIVGNVAYFVSGSSGSYRSDSGDWKSFNNPSIPSTQYGSDHWILQKDNNGCWVIIRMEFNAGHIKFP